MFKGVSRKTAEIIGQSSSRAADQRSAGLTRSKTRKLARLVAEASDAQAGEISPGRIIRRAARPPASEPRRGALLGGAGAPQLTALLDLGAGVPGLIEVCIAYAQALRAAGEGRAVSFDQTAVDAGEAVLALLRRYRSQGR
jgi:hypothetical protein